MYTQDQLMNYYLNVKQGLPLEEAKAALSKAYVPNHKPMVSLDTWEIKDYILSPSVQTKAQQKDNKMCYECDDFEIEGKFDLAKVQYNRLADRLDKAYEDKSAELRRVFFLDDDKEPTSIEELIERLSKGKFTFDLKEWNRSYKKYGYSPMRCVTWRDPKNEPDQDGFDKAKEKLDAAFETAKDEITFTPSLDVLSKFQAKKFH